MTNETSPEEIQKKQEDQQYYDALFNAGYFDIDDLANMRNLAVIKDGKVTYPLYDFMLGGEPPVYEDGKIKSANPPTEDAVKSKLAELAKEGELYCFYYDPKELVFRPQRIEISEQPDKTLKASLSKVTMYDDPEAFPDPGKKPEGLKGWRWFANWITRGRAYRKEKEEADTKIRNWEEKNRSYQKTMSDRKAFLDYKPVREQENILIDERKKYNGSERFIEKYHGRMKAIFGVQPKKTGAKNDNVVDLIQDIPYELPEGISEEMAAALGPMAMCDPDIATRAFDNNKRVTLSPEQQNEIAKGSKKVPFQLLNPIVVHASEDIIKDRDNTIEALGDCYAPARKRLKEALEDYRLNKSAGKLGEIIAQAGEAFTNRYSFGPQGMTDVMYAGMKNNAAVLDLMEKHPAILAAAKANGLSDKTLQALRAQKNFAEIYEKNLDIQGRFLSGAPQSEEKTADDLTDYLLGKMVDHAFVRQTKERDNLTKKVYLEETQKAVSEGKDMREVAKIAGDAVTAFQKNYRDSSIVDDFGKKTVDEMRTEIRNDGKFKEILDEIVKNKNIYVLGNMGKMNRVTNELSEKVVHAAGKNSAEKQNKNELEKEKIREEMLKNAQVSENTGKAIGTNT